MMTIRVFIYFAILFLGSLDVGATPSIHLYLKGNLSQGGLILGRTNPGANVWVNDNATVVNNAGEFVFSLSRNAKPELVLKLTRTVAESVITRVETLSVTQREWKTQYVEGVAKNKVTISDNSYKRIVKEKKSLRTALVGEVKAGHYFHSAFAKGFTQPVEGIVSGVYGSQRFFNGKPRNPHYGLDIAAPTGTPVLAPADGKVRYVHENMFFNGKTLIVYHGSGVFSSFSHLSAINVKENSYVKRGQKIAEVGATGRVTGPHLHWEVKHIRTRVDPQLLILGATPNDWLILKDVNRD